MPRVPILEKHPPPIAGAIRELDLHKHAGAARQPLTRSQTKPPKQVRKFVAHHPGERDEHEERHEAVRAPHSETSYDSTKNEQVRPRQTRSAR